MKKPSREIQQDSPDDKEIFDTWIAAYDAGDLDRLMSIFDDSLRYIAPCQPVQSRDTLRAWYKNDFARRGPRPTWSYQTESIDVGGDLAVIVSRWTAVTRLEGFSADVQRLRSIDFLRNGPDGWKIFRTLNDHECCGDAPASAARPAKKR